MINKKKLVIFVATLMSFSSMASYNVYIDKISKNYESKSAWLDWLDFEEKYDCTEPTPSTNDVDYGVVFTQSLTCKQKQKRERSDRSEYQIRIQSNIFYQENTGLKTSKTGEQTVEYTEWTNVGDTKDCGSWGPNISTANYTTSFEQTTNCKQDQVRTATTYDIWTDGSKTKESSIEQTQSISILERRTLTATVSGWVNYGSVTSCTNWSPATSTVRKGTPFTQTRNCNQAQTRNWQYSTKEGENIGNLVQSRTITVSSTQNATGNRAYNWVYCSAENGVCHFNSSQARYVRYGQNGAYTIQWKGNGVSCSNGAFGDPIVGTVKSCWYDY